LETPLPFVFPVVVLFLAPMSEQAAAQLAPELGHEKLKVVIYTIPMMLHCSGMVGSSWIKQHPKQDAG